MESPETGPFKAFIGNLPFDCTHGDVEHILSSGCNFSEEEIGGCEIRLVRDRETDQFKGFGYVEVTTSEQLNLLLGINGIEFAGRTLRIDLATTKDRGGNGGRGGRGGNRGGPRGGGGGNRGGPPGGEDRRGGGFQVVGRGGRPQNGRSDRRRNSVKEDVVDDPNIDAERPRLFLKPLTTDPAALEAKKKREAEEEAARRAKLFQA